MQHRTTRWLAGLAILASTVSNTPAWAGDRLALSDGSQELVVLDTDAPNASMQRVPVTGLAPNEQIVGLDTRPLDGTLYMLTSASKLYTVDETTGVATPVGPGPLTPLLNGRAHGMDFNPTVDRIRIVTDVDQNLRAIPAGLTGAGTIASVDTSLNYDPMDSGFGFDPRVGAVAYTNNDNDPATGTTLYGLDTERDVLLQQVNPNGGVLITLGSLGDDFTDAAGFDIAPGGTAWAVLQPGPRRGSRLYTINQMTGAADEQSRLGHGRVYTSLAVLF
jgi:hypothetical protein